MFHFEQNFDEPGDRRKRLLTRRATNWYVNVRNEFHTIYEYDEKARQRMKSLNQTSPFLVYAQGVKAFSIWMG